MSQLRERLTNFFVFFTIIVYDDANYCGVKCAPLELVYKNFKFLQKLSLLIFLNCAICLPLNAKLLIDTMAAYGNGPNLSLH